MLIFYIFLFLLVVSGLRYKASFNHEYLSYDTTNAVKGIFILLVFIAHVVPYMVKAGVEIGGGSQFWLIHNQIGQWIVAMFLFYSGYGVMESIKKKGAGYVSGIPKHRCLNTLVNFDVAVLSFIMVALLLGTPLTIKQCLLSLTGWDSVGNSNWYIFIIIVCYAITFVSFYERKDYTKGALICFVLILFTSLLLSCFKGEYWYNTMLCYSAGTFFSLFKNKIENITRSHYYLSLFVVVVLMVLVHQIPYYAKGLVYNSFSVLFCAMILLLTMKFDIKNKFLVWCGMNLFPLYIYQRIPMIILSSVDNGSFVANHYVIYTVCCLLITLAFGYFYKYWTVKF